MRALKGIFILAMLSIPLSPAANAAEQTTTPAPKPPMDPAAMEKMKAAMAPTDAHKALEDFVGKWNYAGKFQMTPDAPPQEMTGTAENSMIYGGRFLKQKIEGPWMGEHFKGLGFTGFDNIKKEYETVWLDNMGTGLMKSSGEYDSATKTLTQSGAHSCPLTGETAREMRSEWTVTGKDHSVYKSYMAGPDGKEFKAMEITYTRAPKA